MKTCSNCWSVNNDDSEFCVKCGTKFAICKEPEIIVSPDKNKEKFNDPISMSMKWRFWLGTWGVVIVASIAVTGTPRCILATPMFPVGLFVWLPNGESKAIEGWMTGAWIFGWLFYILLSIVMFRIKKSCIFFIIYLIFCILLLFNIVGCQRVIQAASGIH